MHDYLYGGFSYPLPPRKYCSGCGFELSRNSYATECLICEVTRVMREDEERHAFPAPHEPCDEF